MFLTAGPAQSQSVLSETKKGVLAQGTQHAQHQPLSGALSQNEEHKQIRFHHPV